MSITINAFQAQSGRVDASGSTQSVPRFASGTPIPNFSATSGLVPIRGATNSATAEQRIRKATLKTCAVDGHLEVSGPLLRARETSGDGSERPLRGVIPIAMTGRLYRSLQLINKGDEFHKVLSDIHNRVQ